MIALDRRAMMDDHRYQQSTSTSSLSAQTSSASSSMATSSRSESKDAIAPLEPEKVATQVLDNCLNEIVIGMCFQMHKAAKMGYLSVNQSNQSDDYRIVDGPEVDVFGNAKSAKLTQECACPKCGRTIVASRLAPHLEKCMGMGRNSSRIANKRIAKTSKSAQLDSALESDVDLEGDGDSDWQEATKPAKKTGVKKRKDRGGLLGANNKKTRLGRGNNRTLTPNQGSGVLPALNVSDLLGGHSSGSSPANSDNGYISYEALSQMDLSDREVIFANQCAVISQTTKRACTKTLRCPQHTDEQRADIRRLFLRSSKQEASKDGGGGGSSTGSSSSSSSSSASSGSAPNSVNSNTNQGIKSEPSSPYSASAAASIQHTAVHYAPTSGGHKLIDMHAGESSARSSSAPLSTTAQHHGADHHSALWGS